MLRVGMFLGDRYEILEKIGSGGMSDVYRAKCHKLNRYVAIKVLRDEFNSDLNFVAKFKMEAQAAAGLAHPNIVNIYDVYDDGHIRFIVMELIDGITLKDCIRKKGAFDPREATSVAIQIAQGIQAAHEQNIIHRDIKPQNVIISKDGKIKVTDFGIARAASTETINSNAMGSVHYISPEQARGGYCDERSDIYSLGITLYEMVTGKVPYEGDTTVTVAIRHLTDEIVPPSQLVSNVPSSLEQIIYKATEKKQERRYTSVAMMIGDMKQSLILPNDSFVEIADKDDMSDTRVLKPSEIKQVKEAAQTSQAVLAKEKRPAVNAQRNTRNNKNRVGNINVDTEMDTEEENVNPKIEKLLNMVGIGAAILIVVIALFIISSFIGFNPFRSSNNNTSNDTEAVSEEETLGENQVRMPNVEGMFAEDAKNVLRDNSLGQRWEYESSRTVEKDYIISQSVAEGTVLDKHREVVLVISTGKESVSVAGLNINAMPVESATSALIERGLLVEVIEEYSDNVEKDKIIRYEPTSALFKGDTVTIFKSLGIEVVPVNVPNIRGLTQSEAKTELERNKLVMGNVTTENSDDYEKGTVMSQSLEAGTEVNSGSVVNIVVSDGAVPVKTYRWYGSINVTFDCSTVFGPGVGNDLQVVVQLEQMVNGAPVYSNVIATQTISSNSKITIANDRLPGETGVRDGVVQIVDIATGEVLRAYPVVFEEYEVSN